MDMKTYHAAATAAAADANPDRMLSAPKIAPSGVLMKLGVDGAGLRNGDELALVPVPVLKLSDTDNGIAPAGNAEVEKGNGGGGVVLPCPVCDKSFLTDKALYGHLRSHSAKGYHKRASRQATLLPRWQLTAKRGRVLPRANAGSSTPPLWHPEEEAAWILVDMSMAYKSLDAELPALLENAADAFDSAGHKNVSLEVLGISDDESNGAKRPKKRLEDLAPLAVLPPEDLAPLAVLPPADHAPLATLPPAAASGDTKRRLVRMPSPASGKRYECTTCHKTFPTHQALGGHRTTHSKRKRGQQQREPGALPQSMRRTLVANHRGTGAGAAGGNRVNPLMPRVPSWWKHVCSQCNLRFPTGQALGGHKRRHWIDPAGRTANVLMLPSGSPPAEGAADVTIGPSVARSPPILLLEAAPAERAADVSMGPPVSRRTPILLLEAATAERAADVAMGPPVAMSSLRLLDFDLNELPQETEEEP